MSSSYLKTFIQFATDRKNITIKKKSSPFSNNHETYYRSILILTSCKYLYFSFIIKIIHQQHNCS